MAVTKPGYMLEHPSIRRYSSAHQTHVSDALRVKIRSVRTISRKPKPTPSNWIRSGSPDRRIERTIQCIEHLAPQAGVRGNHCESGVVCGRPNLPGIVTIERSADMEGVVPELTRIRVLAASAAGTETDDVQ